MSRKAKWTQATEYKKSFIQPAGWGPRSERPNVSAQKMTSGQPSKLSCWFFVWTAGVSARLCLALHGTRGTERLFAEWPDPEKAGPMSSWRGTPVLANTPLTRKKPKQLRRAHFAFFDPSGKFLCLQEWGPERQHWRINLLNSNTSLWTDQTIFGTSALVSLAPRFELTWK